MKAGGIKSNQVMSKKQYKLAPGGPAVADEYLSRGVRYPLITHELSHLLGQVLTVIDAAITEPNQLKAIKDLLKSKFSDKMYGIFWDYCYRKEFDISQPYFRSMLIESLVKHSEMEYAPPHNSALPEPDKIL